MLRARSPGPAKQSGQPRTFRVRVRSGANPKPLDGRLGLADSTELVCHRQCGERVAGGANLRNLAWAQVHWHNFHLSGSDAVVRPGRSIRTALPQRHGEVSLAGASLLSRAGEAHPDLAVLGQPQRPLSRPQPRVVALVDVGLLDRLASLTEARTSIRLRIALSAAPAPQSKVSRESRIWFGSSPLLPSRKSFPSSPLRVSALRLPTSMSSPPFPDRMSLPSKPLRVLFPAPPINPSPPEPPVTEARMLMASASVALCT